MKNKGKNIKESLKLTTLGFTLVELLAVIVILAIILVIAVPKVMSVIEDAKKATLESTAKMIAGSAEKVKVQNTLLGKDVEITCEDVAKLNNVDYESCSIEFEENTAKVTLIGKGKFAGLNVCNGRKNSSSVVNVSCSEVCDINEEMKTYTVIKDGSYEVDDIETCKAFFLEKSGDLSEEGTETMTTLYEGLCKGKEVLGTNLTSVIVANIASGNFTEEELLNFTTVGVIRPYEVEDIDSCVSIVKPRLEAVGAMDLASIVEPVCNGETVDGYDINAAATMLIDWGVFTEEELIENNIIKTKKARLIKPWETEEVKVCIPTKSINAATYLSNMVKDENARKALGLIVDDTTDKNIRYAGKKPNNKVYFNCAESDLNGVAYGEDTYDYANSCEIWRIIGVFNTKSSETDTTGVKRIKIVREDSIGNMAWDTTADGVYSINQWGPTTLTSDNTTPYAGASLMQYLNGNTEGNYYHSLSSIAKRQIGDALWYTGAVERGTVSEVYVSERSDTTLKGTKVNYTTTWVGKIGLIYPSDFGYAGTNCGDYKIGDYSELSSCGMTRNWLKPTSTDYWTISPLNSYYYVWDIYYGGCAGNNDVHATNDVRPALYLSSNVKITGGNGADEPYKLAI